MNLIQLMKSYDNQPLGTIKLVRHTREKGKDVEQLYKQGLLNTYQSAQRKPVFDTCDYVMAFIATENDKCVFIGMYKVAGKTTVAETRRTQGLPDLGMEGFYQDDQNFYDLQEIDFMSDLKDRLIISWGNTGIAWHQYLVEKEVIEILPANYVREYPGHDDLILSFTDLKTIIDNKEANREWHRQLSSIAGVYLILDTITGSQYVGSAYGKEGILGRWTTYAKTHHGGNQQLIALLQQYPDRYNYFQYSILKTLPTALVKDDVLKYEALYKQKLGTRVFGLNSN